MLQDDYDEYCSGEEENRMVEPIAYGSDGSGEADDDDDDEVEEPQEITTQTPHNSIDMEKNDIDLLNNFRIDALKCELVSIVSNRRTVMKNRIKVHSEFVKLFNFSACQLKFSIKI